MLAATAARPNAESEAAAHEVLVCAEAVAAASSALMDEVQGGTQHTAWLLQRW